MQPLDKLANQTANNLLHVYLLCAKEGLTLTLDKGHISVVKDGKSYSKGLNIYQDLFILESSIYKIISEVKKDIQESKSKLFDEKLLKEDYLKESL